MLRVVLNFSFLFSCIRFYWSGDQGLNLVATFRFLNNAILALAAYDSPNQMPS